MSEDRLKSLFTFFYSTTLLVVLVLANFYKTEILEYFPFLPKFSILLISTAIVIFLVLTVSSWANENNRLKYEFVSVVTHKFRTPLTGIKWAIATLRKDITLEQKEDLFKEIERETQRLVEIVDLVVNFVKFDEKLEYAYEAVSLREMVDGALQRYAKQIREKNIHFRVEPAQSLPLIIIDKRKIQFVIDMLFDNAIRYTPPRGKISVLFVQKNRSIILSISDTGIGIEPSDLKRIFTRFFRGADAKKIDTEGMGLGLNTAKIVIEKHGGKIWVESKGKNQGSTFFVELKTKR